MNNANLNPNRLHQNRVSIDPSLKYITFNQTILVKFWLLKGSNKMFQIKGIKQEELREIDKYDTITQ